MAKNISITAQGTSFDLVTNKGTKHITMSLVGQFNVYNVLAAVATCIAAGIPFEIITEAVEELHGVRGRFELVNQQQEFPVIVDYAHTPDSLENVLETCRDMTEGKLFVVVGQVEETEIRRSARKWLKLLWSWLTSRFSRQITREAKILARF